MSQSQSYIEFQSLAMSERAEELVNKIHILREEAEFIEQEIFTSEKAIEMGDLDMTEELELQAHNLALQKKLKKIWAKLESAESEYDTLNDDM